METGLFGSCLYISTIGTFQIFYIAALGILFKKYKVVDDKFENSLSKIIANLMLPSFIFCEVILNFDSQNYYQLVQSILGSITINFSALLVGYIYSKICGHSENEKNLILALLSSQSTTSMGLILIQVLNPILNNLKFNQPLDATVTVIDARQRGLLYISLLSIISNVWRWTITYNLINEDSKTELQQCLLEKHESINNNMSQIQIVNSQRGWKDIFLGLINVPIVVALITLAFSLSSTIKNILTDENSIIKQTLFSVHMTISKSYTFCVILMLGLNISNVIGTDKTSKEDTNIQQGNYNRMSIGSRNTETEAKPVNYTNIVITSLLKLLAVPIVGTPMILYFRSQNLIYDPVLVYLLLFGLFSPSAINIMLICNLKKAWEKYVTLYMGFSNCLSIITITISNAVILYLLSA